MNIKLRDAKRKMRKEEEEYYKKEGIWTKKGSKLYKESPPCKQESKNGN